MDDLRRADRGEDSILAATLFQPSVLIEFSRPTGIQETAKRSSTLRSAPMPADVTGVKAKIDRAYDHLQRLHEETLRFIQRYPYGLAQETENEGRRHVGILQIYREPDPVAFGLLIGDCANNLRSALDYLVVAVARESLDPHDFDRWEGHLAFPICESSEAWEEALRRHRLEGVNEQVRREIEKRQPYRTSNPPAHAPLALLQWINNTDKHRLIHTVAGYVQAAEVNFDPGLMPGSFTMNVPRGPHTDAGARVFELDLVEPAPNLQVKFTMILQILVRGLPVSEDARELLLKAGQMVQRIVDQVAKVA